MCRLITQGVTGLSLVVHLDIDVNVKLHISRLPYT